MNENLKKIEVIAKKFAIELDMQIVSVDFVLEDGMKILRIIARKEPVMTIEDSSALNRKIGAELDKIDIFEDEYYLEVSSEGIEKELRTNSEINEAIGEYICIRVKEKIVDKKEIYGDLIAFDNEKLEIKVNHKGQTKNININLDQIEKIRLAIKF
ncbi:MAG: hypothetical protein PHX62_03825 [Bacilli bacterium]|nr:hypothetical protein [Bacilli bacterium]